MSVKTDSDVLIFIFTQSPHSWPVDCTDMLRLFWITLSPSIFCKFLPISAATLVTCLPANQPPAGFLPRSLHGSFHSHSRPLISESDSSAQTALISASMFCPLWITHTVSAGWHTELVSAIAKGCHLLPASHTTGPSETPKPFCARVYM